VELLCWLCLFLPNGVHSIALVGMQQPEGSLRLCANQEASSQYLDNFKVYFCIGFRAGQSGVQELPPGRMTLKIAGTYQGT
jgi:hypothetical protein